MKHLLPVVPKYFKTNLHTHTNISDGHMTPEEIVERYKDAGYQVLRKSISQLGKTGTELAVYAEELIQQTKDKGWSASFVLEREAFVLYNLKLYNVAYKLFEQAVSYADNSDKGRMAYLYDWMSIAAHQNGDYGLAVENSRNAVEMMKAGNDIEDICKMYCGLGESISFWLQNKRINMGDVVGNDWEKELEPLYLEAADAFSVCCRQHKYISAAAAHRCLEKWADFICIIHGIASSLVQREHIQDCIECMEAFKNGKNGSICDRNFDSMLQVLYKVAGKK